MLRAVDTGQLSLLNAVVIVWLHKKRTFLLLSLHTNTRCFEHMIRRTYVIFLAPSEQSEVVKLPTNAMWCRLLNVNRVVSALPLRITIP